MKNLLTYLAVLTLSFNVFAMEVQDKPEGSTADVKIALNQEQSPDARLAAHVVHSQTIARATREQSSDSIAELGVYLIIIIVYSIYGFSANAKNIEH